ncbi:phage tail protein [Streptomyces sp. FBKL.4005]|uniref:phage tail protein n=1 Tax=Streptomyces sp. FBKL.4005 TaxID=2015515 RepID=UPI000B968DDE|nr:phage tail protein [Streptomyces sp. FBKL.4005]OYP14081.1 phage tail protein [Streptomyces sp. FBKL.4005]
MGNDIEIRVRVANQTAAGLAAVNRSLNQLRNEARDAGRGLDGLAARAGVAAASLRALKDSAQDAARAIRSLNTAARNADTRMGTMSDRSRTLRRDTDDLDSSMRRLTTTIGDLRGGNGNLRVSLNNSGRGLDNLRKAAIMLSPALIPIAAAAVPIAASLTAAGVAVAAFGLAIGGQLAAVKDASDAQKKLDDAVKKHGAASKEAAQAEAAYLDQLKTMDPATRKAAASLTVLKDQYKQWSKSLAGDTMPVFTKGLAVAGALLPKLTPAVKGASTELDRFMTILGGGIQSAGFSKFMDSFTQFATGALSRANDALVHFMRTMSGGAGSSQLSEFMDYVRKVGPQVGETLGNLSKALVHLVAAASDTGLSVLTLVNALAKLVNAIPTGLLSNVLQLYAGFKLLQVGMAGVSGLASAAAVGRLRAYFQVMGRAGVGTTLRATAASLTTMQKLGGVAGVLGAVALGINALAEKARGAPPDVDKLVTSLKGLASTGKFSGELQKTFGSMDGFVAKVGKLRTESSALNKIKPFESFSGMGGLFGTFVEKVDDLTRGTKSLGATKDDLKSFDKAFAQLASGGHAKEAAKQFQLFEDALKKAGYSQRDINKLFPEYKSTLADAKYEQELAAQSMGLFGEQAQKTSAQLNEQKASADGLRQSIQALNDTQRQGLGGMIGFEAAIDNAAKAAKDNAGALSMSGGVLNLNSEKARNAASALQDLAAKTDEAAGKARESGASWSTVNGIYERGRSHLIASAQAMGLTKKQAQQLAAQILKTPDKTAMIKADIKDLEGKIADAKEKLKTAAPSKTAKIRGDIRNLQNAVGLAKAALMGIQPRTVTVTVIARTAGFAAAQAAIGALGGLPTLGRARGGLVPGYADGGSVQAFPVGGLVQGPGTPTSDSITAVSPAGAYRVSDSEYVVQASAVRKYGVAFMDMLNSGRLKLAGFARGGKVSKAQQRAREQAKAEAEARREAMGDLTISYFGRMAGYQRSEFGSALGKPQDLGSLVNALNQWRSIIMKATHGSTESRLLKQLDSAGRSLLKWEKQLGSVTKSLEGARSKLSDLKNAAAQLRDSVKGNLLSSANITRGASGDGPVTLNTIRSGMRTSKDKITAFAAALKQLRAKGFSKSIIQQVAEAGVDGGGLETAGALLQASASEVKTINDTQAQIEAAAGSAGKTAADAVYDKAIKQQERYVKSLEAQQKKLTTSMDRLAKSMERAIEKAFGKKAAGGIVGAAASGGLRSSLTWVGEQGPELLDLPAGSRVWSNPDSRRKLAAAEAPWASMLTAPRRTPAAAAGAAPAGRPEPIVLELRSSGSHVDELLLQILRKAIRVRGGNVNVVLTGRP